MKLFLIQIFIVSILAYFTAIIVKRWDTTTSTWIFITLAISGVLVTHAVRYITEKLSDPNVKIEINLSSTKNEKMIKIIAENYVQSLNLYMPFDGEITEIHGYINPGDARQVKLINAKAKFWANQKTSYQSTLDLMVENLLPRKQLRYVMQFESLKDVSSPAYENYKVSYSWNHDGNTQYREKWVSFATGKEVKEPSVQVGSFTIYR